MISISVVEKDMPAIVLPTHKHMYLASSNTVAVYIGQYDAADESESYYADSPKLQSYQQGHHQGTSQ